MSKALRRVRVLANPKSGVRWSLDSLRRAFDRHWDREGTDLSYQFCQSIADGVAKARRAVGDGVDTVIVVGGDGTVSTVGRVLLNTDVSLGVVPAGSGNGFARHFGIPLAPRDAVEALARASTKRIDVGVVNGLPFLVTCSMAWDAALVQAFDRMPVRGILPYVFAGVQEFFEYEAQEFRARADGGPERIFPDPLVFTVANLTQYGGGARIAPDAREDDGELELVAARRQDIAVLVANVARFFDGTVTRIPQVVSQRFKRLQVRRAAPAPIQVDGELVAASADVEVAVVPGALKVLAPSGREEG
jgi:YegS/Rv2252/BmrU family lipid kinase